MYENHSLIDDWDTLRLILSIDRHGGVAGAARALGVTHATVSRRLARAEGAAGLTFFERLPAGLRLTEAGRAALSHAERIAPEVDALERRLAAQDAGVKGPIRLTIPPLMMTKALAGDLAAFAAMHPEARLEFVGDNALANLSRREADIAIRVTRAPPETLWGRKAVAQEAGYYAAADWLAAHPIGAGDLAADLPVVSFTSWPAPLPARLARLCPKARVAARSDDMATAMRMVEAGLGVTRMPRVLGASLKRLRLVEALPREGYAPIWLLTHPDLRRAKRVEALMSFLYERLRAQRGDYVFAD